MRDKARDRRPKSRRTIDKYHSVEFSISDCPCYQFKTSDTSSKGICVLVREDSCLVDHLKVGDILNLKYYPADSAKPPEFLKQGSRISPKTKKGILKAFI
jgi:hypothetical protein